MSKKINWSKRIKRFIKKNKLKFDFKEMLTITILSVLIGFLIGSSMSYGTDSANLFSTSKELDEFIETYNNIYSNYYDKVKEKDLVNAAIKGMVSELDDPYSEFLENEESTLFNESVDGEYVGIGATVRYDGEKVTIVDMFEKSPAKKAGLKVGDQLIKIEDKVIKDIELSKVSKLIKGKPGTKVTVTVLRDNKEKEITITRSKIDIPRVKSKVIEKGKQKVGYISIDIFSANTDKEFEKELKTLENKKIDSLIIDVRNNPGGHLLQVTNIIELFTKKNQVIYKIEKKNSVKKVKDRTKESRDYDIVVLINNESASASEILASSLKNVYKAKLVGNTTYGKGTVQSTYQLSTGDTLKYTSQKWLTSTGKWIDKKGIKPDYEEKLSEEYYDKPSFETDNQISKATEILTKKEEKTK